MTWPIDQRSKTGEAPITVIIDGSELFHASHLFSTDADGVTLQDRPAMPIAIALQTERAPGRHAQMDQIQLGVDEEK